MIPEFRQRLLLVTEPSGAGPLMAISTLEEGEPQDVLAAFCPEIAPSATRVGT